MKLWKRAAGALKDQNSLLVTALSRRTQFRNPDLEAAVIKATSHDEARVDYRNAQRVFAWARTSPSTHLKPLVWAIASRAHRTRSWPVALKCLMLLHGIFCCKVPAVERIGRLPLDLSDFSDGHSSPSETWVHNAFVRAYFNFLDKKSMFLYADVKEIRKVKAAGPEDSIMAEIVMLQRLEWLLALLLQVRPQPEGMRGLVLEAMDCVIIEIFDTYGKVCNLIARVLSRIHRAPQAEASTALAALRQANTQGEELDEFFEFCKSYGVINASQFPKVERIPEEDIREVERIVKGRDEEELKAMVMKDRGGGEENGELVPLSSSGKVLQTVVTSQWEVFDDDGEDLLSVHGGDSMERAIASVTSLNDPQSHHVHAHKLEIPDLITF